MDINKLEVTEKDIEEFDAAIRESNEFEEQKRINTKLLQRLSIQDSYVLLCTGNYLFYTVRDDMPTDSNINVVAIGKDQAHADRMRDELNRIAKFDISTVNVINFFAYIQMVYNKTK